MPARVCAGALSGEAVPVATLLPVRMASVGHTGIHRGRGVAGASAASALPFTRREG